MRIEKLSVDNASLISSLFGNMDENVALLSKELGVGINAVGSDLVISGEEEAVDGCLKIIDGAFSLIKREGNLRPYHVKMLLDMLLDSGSVDISGLSDSVAVTDSGRPVKCRTVGQRKYVKAINENGLTFCIGPAGTGKTYLAVARAVTAYRNKEVEKIILTRPAVEAGERLGFLPGDLQQKVDPYLRPLYDALQEMFGFDAYAKMMERGVIEVAPLAYMRGRTLSNAFIILDEAQNTTSEQMKMFLTRMGDGSKMVVTGDTTQIDLPKGVNSGLLQAVNILGAVEGIAVCKLSAKDVVRNSLVQKIVNAYDNYSKKQNK